MGVGSATLGPGLGGLWAFADPLAKRLLIRQLVILGLLRIGSTCLGGVDSRIDTSGTAISGIFKFRTCFVYRR